MDQVADIGLVDDGFEQPARALVEAAAVEAVGRGGQADHAQARPLGAQGGQEAAVAGLGVARDEMRLVDDDEVDARRGRGVRFQIDWMPQNSTCAPASRRPRPAE